MKSSQPKHPQYKCEPVFLGPDIGYSNVMQYHDSDGSCQLSVTELAKVCKAYFQECMKFLESSNV
jgi:hypothetical protein